MINTDSMPLLQGLSDAELNEILLYSKSRSYQKNTIIINEGDDTDSLYIIDTGGVKVYLSDDNGKEVVINTLQAGEYFGELAILIPGKRSASVVTTENASFKVIHKNDFKELLLNNPCIAYTLLENLARRVRDLTDNVKSLALQDVYGRVVKTLMALSVPFDPENNEKRIIRHRLTQQEIANRVGSSREMVARILKDLSLGNYISLENKQITINTKLPEHY